MPKTGRHAMIKPTAMSKLRNAVSFGIISTTALLVGAVATLFAHFADEHDGHSRYIDAV